MFRYWTFRFSSLVIGIGALFMLVEWTPREYWTIFSLVFCGIYFTLYGLAPKVVSKMFGLDPDENFIEEFKKDLELSFRRSKK